MAKQYQAQVEVQSANGYRYWNALGAWEKRQDFAQADIATYQQHKANGTGGFRQGPPGRTRIGERGFDES